MTTRLEYGNEKVHYYSEEEKVALSKKKMLTKYKGLIAAKLGVTSDFNDEVLECLFQAIIDSIKEDMEAVNSNYPGSELISGAPGAPVTGVITTGKIKPGGFR